MAHIKISHPTRTPYGVLVTVDGVELEEVGDIRLDIPVGDVAKLYTSFNIHKDFFPVTLPADVHVTFECREGLSLVLEPVDGKLVVSVKENPASEGERACLNKA